MDDDKRKRLEQRGFSVGDASDFLDLDPADEVVVELRLALARELRRRREEQNLTQQQLAERCSTSQARVSNLENAREGTTIDALVAALAELGADREEIGRIVAT